MRFAPAAAALSLLAAVTSSVGLTAEHAPDPRAATLVAEGRAALSAGESQKAIDAFEAALAVDPGYTAVFLNLARAAQSDGLQGKAIAYYREALERDPDNYAALSGQGEAMLAKGALGKAKINLGKLESLCGRSCPETQILARAIAEGPKQQVLTAEAVMPDPVVTQN